MFDDSGDNTITNNNIGWCDVYTGYDDRTTSHQNSWISNAFNDFSGNPYSIDGAAGVADASASLLTDSTNPVIASPDDIAINSTDTDKWVTWTAFDTFQNNYTLYVNNSNEDTNDWCGSSISFSLDALDPGVYNFQLWVFDCENNSISDIVIITVIDTHIPVFTNFTDDYTIELGEHAWLNFSAIDHAPDLKMAWIDEQGPYLNDAWISSIPFNWDSGTPIVGVHNYTIKLTDKAGNYATRTCWITVVDTTAPVVVGFPSDFSSETGNTTWVNFTLGDYSPDTYEIWVDDIMDTSLTFTNGEYISYMLNYNTPGEHNITLVAWDDYVNTVTQACIVTYEDSTGPSITEYDDFSYEAGESPIISWAWDELDPKNWSVYENGTLMISSTSFSGNIQHSLEEQTLGKWNVTLVIYDETGNRGIDQIWVTVVDTTAPEIDSLLAVIYEEGEVDNSITWTPYDLKPESYEVLRNGTSIDSGPWSGSIITIDVDGLDAGVYNYTITVTDSSGNTASDTVTVIVTFLTSTTTTTTTTTTNTTLS